jgi:hypothetical protein
MGFPDPAKVQGSEDEILNAFRAVRDGIYIKVSALVEAYQDKLNY